jgi:hypothetical protein
MAARLDAHAKRPQQRYLEELDSVASFATTKTGLIFFQNRDRVEPQQFTVPELIGLLRVRAEGILKRIEKQWVEVSESYMRLKLHYEK